LTVLTIPLLNRDPVPFGVWLLQDGKFRRREVGAHDRLVGLTMISAGAQPGHGIPEPGGSRRTRKDTKAAASEFWRTNEEP